MLKSQSTFFKHSKLVYVGISVLIIVFFNMLLSNALHQRIHKVGEQLVQQIYTLNLDPQLHAEVTQALVNSSHFMLEPVTSTRYFQHIVKVEREVFSFKDLSMNLYHWPAWVMQSYIFVLLNLVLLGAAAWGMRWWNMLFEPTKPPLNGVLATIRTQFTHGDNNINKRLIESKRSPLALPAKAQNLFIIVNLGEQLYSLSNMARILQLALKGEFVSLPVISVKSLKNNEFAITLMHVGSVKIDDFIERLHHEIYICCQQYVNLAKDKIKMGVCNYYPDADQVSVYLLAKSALNKVKQQKQKYFCRYAINRDQLGALSNVKVIDSIKQNKFIILFQPLFDLSEGEIIQHEALIRIKNSPEGLIAARSFIDQVTNENDALLVDQAVLLQVKKILENEPSSIKISINLHLINWQSENFWQWLILQFNELQFSNKIQFEIKESHFIAHKNTILSVINKLNIKHVINIVIDNVKSIDNMAELSRCANVRAIKLSYELVHLININKQLQRQVKQIVQLSTILQIPVYAVGIETQKELKALTELGVNAAQGFYFSEPLEEFSQTVFH